MKLVARADQEYSFNAICAAYLRATNLSSASVGPAILNARYYDGGRGQFLSQDPTHLSVGNPQQIRQLTGLTQERYLLDPQSLNSYSYARNNPVVNKDPQGNFALVAAIPYAVITAPEWAPWVAGGIIAAGTYIASDIALRTNGYREIPFDARRLPPAWMMGPQSPMEVRPPNIDPKTPKWIAGPIIAGLAAQAVQEFVEPMQKLDSYLKRLREQSQQSANSSSQGGQSYVRANNVPSSQYSPQSQSGGGGTSLSSLLGQLQSALGRLQKALSGNRNSN